MQRHRLPHGRGSVTLPLRPKFISGISNPTRPHESYLLCHSLTSGEENMNQTTRRVYRLGSALLLLGASAFAASHRNGPMLLEDQTANLNDFYLFRSYENGRSNYVVMSMSAQGFQNPDNGPSYYKFSDTVAYRFNINNQRGLDGNPDIEIDFVFNTLLRPNPTFVSYFGTLKGIDDPGIFLYQTYNIVIRNVDTGASQVFTTDVNGHALSVAPPNLGPKSTPAYE